ncbi:thiamine/thiamine pyrophosphate ABC transporter permease [Aureimonas leprariae]|uniref:Thiamine transport system permease protein ThiP n=1 Tax=Plantimonas leprariae TaxID=2615207 RepID=A0A7V7TW32_9HYPH|nr:thiamine/thiamine pyrophosphate ABC transporter permease [Aureimonas leprariae]KAB0679235.1 thiamine/thiamine pyrophosphate ABC transporter, permease protein [Aureimonas leprariae]
MAAGDRPLSAHAFPDPDRGWKLGLGLGAAALLWLFLGTAFAALLASGAGETSRFAALLGDPYLRGVAVFTLEQAALSALLSVAGALPLALALHRTRFFGRRAVLRLFLLPQALPVLVGALGILAVWGRGGIVSEALAALGLPRLDIYGLSGILLAHVFFNLPLATRMIFASLDAVPAESWRLAGQLGMPPGAVFRLVEWPAARQALPGALSLAFAVCVTSFTLVLVLGGGPGATTLEVEIYQSLRADFDPNRAVALSLAQVLLAAVFAGAAARLGGRIDAGFALGRPVRRFDRRGAGAHAFDTVVLTFGLGFVASPFAAILVRGLRADLGRLLGEAGVLRAILTSSLVAFAAAVLGLLVALALLLGEEAVSRRGRRGGALLLAASGQLVLVVPPLVIGAGWFLALRGWTDAFAFGPILVVATNAVMTLPFTLRILGPPLREALQRHERLAAHLALRGWTRFRHVELPALGRPLGLAFALALALSLGDLGVAALFGDQDFTTLPFLLLQRMGSYRTSDAAGLALILGALSLLLVLGAEGLFARRRGSDTDAD